MKNNEIFICSKRSALNMSYQDMTETRGKVEQVGKTFKGLSLIGLATLKLR